MIGPAIYGTLMALLLLGTALNIVAGILTSLLC
jgi:hypothetical protein